LINTSIDGGAENAGHENDGPAKYRVVKMQFYIDI